MRAVAAQLGLRLHRAALPARRERARLVRTDDQRRAAIERGDGAADPASGNGPADPLVQGDFRALWLALELARAPLPAHWVEDEVALPPPQGKGVGAARIFRRTAGRGEAPLTTLEHPLTPVFREVAVRPLTLTLTLTLSLTLTLTRTLTRTLTLTRWPCAPSAKTARRPSPCATCRSPHGCSLRATARQRRAPRRRRLPNLAPAPPPPVSRSSPRRVAWRGARRGGRAVSCAAT